MSWVGEGRAKGPLNVYMVFKETIRTILKPITVLCRLHAMQIHITDTLSVSGIPYFNYKPNRFDLKVAPFAQ